MSDIALTLAQRDRGGSSTLVGLAALGDIVLMQGWFSQDLPMIWVITVHVALSLALAVTAFFLCRVPLSATLASLAFLVLFGPFGGLAMMVVAPGLALPQAQPGPRHTPRRSSAPLKARDAADLLYDQICQGRRHPLPAIPAQGFLETFRSGTLTQQQAAIAAISRSYHPTMRPALLAALASPVPALRVQAAAVYAKLRGTYGARAKALLAAADGNLCAPPVPDPADLLEVAASGFVDDEMQERLRLQATRMVEAESMPSPVWQVPGRPALPPALEVTPRLQRHACGGLG